MSGFRLFGIVFGLSMSHGGHEPVLRRIFELCPETETAVDVTIGSRFLCGESAGDELGGWLRDGLERIARSPGLVSMWRGPEGETAVATFVDGMASLAWAMPGFERVDLAVWQRDAVGHARGGAALRELRGTGAIQSVLPPVLRELFLGRGQLLVHCAALRCPDGTGIVISAPGGGGKTTTALSVLRKGGRLLGDDLNLLEIDGGAVRARGFPELLNITETTMGFFPELREAPSFVPEDSGSHKKVVSARTVYGEDSTVEDCEITAVYFTEVTAGEPGVVRLRGPDAFGRLMHAQTFANGQVPNAECFARLSDILERVNAYELRTGSDPDRLGDWLIENCAEHANVMPRHGAVTIEK